MVFHTLLFQRGKAMPIANRFVLDQIVGILNVLDDDEVSMVQSESDENGYRELIRRHIASHLKSLTPESRKLASDSLQYFLSQDDDVFEDSLDRQQESPMVRPASARNFFRWIFDEVFASSALTDKDAKWTISESRAASQLVHKR